MAVHDMLMAAAGGTAGAVNYVDDVFSTYLYTGTGSTQTITNGIDLSTKGGMVWLKSRSAATDNFLFDTARGATKELNSNTTDAEATLANSLTAFNANGFSISSATGIGVNAATYASWTFRKQAKFFDIVTYTGNFTDGRVISHNLGSVPGCIIVKRLDTTRDWRVYHRSLTADYTLNLNLTDSEQGPFSNRFQGVSSTTFTIGTDSALNANGGTYVAYIFAHDAGGFGAAGTDNVISCGSFSGSATVNLGYEPQWVLTKRSDSTGNWYLIDNMRGFTAPDGASGNNSNYLFANTTAAESSYNLFSTTSTGFSATGATGTYIYIAIRRPMKPPTTGTEVFSPNATTSTGSGDTGARGTGTIINSGFNTDLVISKERNTTMSLNFYDRLRGSSRRLGSASTAAEINSSGDQTWFDYSGKIEDCHFGDLSGYSLIDYCFRRAPGFFDEVCYTGTGSATTQAHNLGVVPELMIVKCRNVSGENWIVYHSFLGNTKFLILNGSGGENTSSNIWNNTTPTNTVFTIGTDTWVNGSSATYVAYLFATVAGVSKVGSYTGTGTTNQINCGFTGGSRFVMIKRTDDTGAWYVWDTARGIVSGNDPYLLMNTTAAEDTSTDYIDPYSAGFEISSTAPAAINANGGSFIYLAIA